MRPVPNTLAVAVLATVTAFASAGRQPPQAAAPADPAPITPSETYRLALTDAATIADVRQREHTRYLAMHYLAPAERATFTQLIDRNLNDLSTRQRIAYTSPVAGSNGAVVRVQLHLYGIDPAAWDRLAERGSGPAREDGQVDAPEPYYQLTAEQAALSQGQDAGKPARKKRRVKVSAAPYKADDGKTYDWRWQDEEYDVNFLPPTWVDPRWVRDLGDLCRTDHPILRADWFLFSSLLAPAYYDLMGVKTLADFDRLTRFRADDEEFNGRAVVVRSRDVSLHDRAAVVTPTIFGARWRTIDFKTARGADVLLRDLLKNQGDAGEIFAEGPNGGKKFALTNAQNNLINVADTSIVVDMNGKTGWNDHRVWAGGFSCTACHVNGARDLPDEVRGITGTRREVRDVKGNLVTDRPFFLGNTLASDDDRRRDEAIKDQYTKPVKRLLQDARDRERAYTLAATRGMTPEKHGAELSRFFVRYAQVDLNLADAAADVGTTPERLRLVLPKLVQPDYTHAQLDAARTVRRDNWERLGFPQMATLVFQGK